MNVGALRHHVTIEAPIGTLTNESPLAALNETQAVSVATGVPAKIEVVPLQFQHRESIAGGGLRTETIYTVTVRYREDLRASYQLLEQCCTQRRFQILAIIPSDRKDATDMTCVTNG